MRSESIKEKLERRSAPNKDTGCIEWLGATALGYGLVNRRIKKGARRITRSVHRLAYQEYVGEIPEGLLVCHHCDNRKCINPKHLFLGTHKDNADDRQNKGRGNQAFGERNHFAKLTELQVILIRQLRRYGIAQKKVAAAFGVHEVTIRETVSRKRWRNVK